LAVLSPISFRKEMGRRAAQAHKAQEISVARVVAIRNK
jgi:hypothetical protein